MASQAAVCRASCSSTAVPQLPRRARWRSDPPLYHHLSRGGALAWGRALLPPPLARRCPRAGAREPSPGSPADPATPQSNTSDQQQQEQQPATADTLTTPAVPPSPSPAAAAAAADQSNDPTPLERLLAAAVFILPLAEGLHRVWLLALQQARDNAWHLCIWSAVQRQMLADAIAEGGARAARSQGELQAAQAVAAMSQRLLSRIEEPLQEALALATQPVIDVSALPLPPALAGAAAALLTPTALCVLGLLVGVVLAAAAAAWAAAAAEGREQWQRHQQQQQREAQEQQWRQGQEAGRSRLGEGHASAGGAAAAVLPQLAAAAPPALRAPAVVAAACSAAVLLRVSWAPLTSALASQPGACVPGGVIASAIATYASISSLLSWGTTALALGALLRMLLTAAPRAAAAEAAGAAVIAAACHRALLLADTVLAVASDLPTAAKLAAAGRLAVYGLAVEALSAGAEDQRARLKPR